MPFVLNIDATTSIACVRGHGVITPDDVRIILDELVTAGATHLPLLVDVRDATVRLFPAEVQECVDLRIAYQAQHGSVRVAAIAGDPVAYGVLYMYQRLSAGHEPELRIFLLLSEAMDWLQQTQ